MTQQPDDLPPVGAILAGPHWPAHVRSQRPAADGPCSFLGNRGEDDDS